jgi:hypothetical protein
MSSILRRSTIFFLVALCFSILPNALMAQKATGTKAAIEIEVIFEPGVSANASAQKWAKQLGDLGFGNVRFRQIQNGDQMGVQTQGRGASASYLVTAQLNSRGTLVTPGGQFGYGDGVKLKKWLEDVQAGGGLPGQRKTLFGLSGKQLDEVKKDLSSTVGFSTKGLRPEQVVEKIRAQLKTPLMIDRAIEKAIAADDPVRDEFIGLSAGTALAAIARPAGGVVVPRAGAKGVELAIVAPQSNVEMWPIGWPPEEKDEANVVPMLYQFTEVEIDGVTAEEAIDAIQTRLKTPLVWDYNNMVRGRVDLKKTVKVKAGKTYYRRILDQVLYQAGLKCEVRTDDAGKPLLWITTL